MFHAKQPPFASYLQDVFCRPSCLCGILLWMLLLGANFPCQAAPNPGAVLPLRPASAGGFLPRRELYMRKTCTPGSCIPGRVSDAFTATWHRSEAFSHGWVCAEPSPCCLPPSMFVLFDAASCSPQYTALVSYPTSSFCLSLQFVQFVKMILNCTHILTGICFIFVAPAGRISTHFPSLLLAKMLENMKPRTDTLWKWTSSNYPPAMTSQLYVPFSNSSEL